MIGSTQSRSVGTAGRPILLFRSLRQFQRAALILSITGSALFNHGSAAAGGQNYVVPQEPYSQWQRTSQYVTVRDGTKLAVDIYRPSVAGAPVDHRLPVILVATPYHRAGQVDGKVVDALAARGSPDRALLASLLKHGYVIAILDTRGRGASFGTAYGGISTSDQDRWDLFDVIEWLAVEPWSDGHIGMAGCSYEGQTQYFAAEVMPPHLKAIAPCGAVIDIYGLLRANGITQIRYAKNWDESMRQMEFHNPGPAVDADQDGALLKSAIAEHRISWDSGVASATPARAARLFRDTPPPRAEYSYGAAADWNFVSNFKTSKIPVLEYAGWRDMNLEGALAWYRSVADTGTPQELIIGPWYHCEWYGSDLVDPLAIHLRWYDYWLKGIKNGVMDGPMIRYYTVGAPVGHEWHSASQWPLPNEHHKTYYLRDGRVGTGSRPTLTIEEPSSHEGKDDYVADYTTTTAGIATRLNGPIPNSGPHPGLLPIDSSALDAKSLTYTTAPLKEAAELTGYPSIALWISSTAKDQDFYVYLEDIDQSGRSCLISEGAIRASNRATRDAPFDNQSMPWHPGFKADYAELPSGIPVRIEWALYPLSNYIAKGHRLRVAINNFDDGWDTPILSPAPSVGIFHDAQHPSSLRLPFVMVSHISSAISKPRAASQ